MKTSAIGWRRLGLSSTKKRNGRRGTSRQLLLERLEGRQLLTGPTMYYVNDPSTVRDEWATAPGNDANDGLTPATPKASVQAILQTYDLNAGDRVRIDTGTYNLASDIYVGPADGGSDAAPVTFEASPYGVTVNRGDTRFGNTWFIAAPYLVLTTASSTKYANSPQRWMQVTGGYRGVCVEESNTTISRLDVTANGAWGMELYGPGSRTRNVTIENCIVRDTRFGSGIRVNQAEDVTIQNCTISGNYSAGVYYLYSGLAGVNTLRNNIIWGNSPAWGNIFLSKDGVVSRSDYNDLGTPISNIANSLAGWQSATGNDAHSISIDPGFVNAAGGDFHIVSNGGRYDPATGLPPKSPLAWRRDPRTSPAIDRGNPASPYARESAPNGGRINLGAYGNTEQASRSDNNPPNVVGVSVSDPLLSDTDAGPGKIFAVTVDFSEVMNTAVTPALELNPTAGTSLSNPSSVWRDEDTFVVTFQVSDQNVQLPNIWIDVNGAKDAVGNFQADYVPRVRFAIDTKNPTASVTPVTPNPRVTAVDQLTIAFSESIVGFDKGDLALTRDGGANLLTASQTLTTTDGGRTWILGNLASLTAVGGVYRMRLTAAGSGIRDAAGNLLQSDVFGTWTCLAGQISGAKWGDRDGDGTWDAGEQGLNGWTIELLNAQGQRLASTVTRDMDLNGDGRIDPASERGRYVFEGLAAGNYTVREVAQAGWLQRFPARFDLAAPVSYGAGTGPESVIATDFNSDGRLDLVVANAYGGSLSLLTNLGAGRFSNKTDIVLGGVIGYVSAGDLNADGRIDLIASDQVTTNPGGGPASRLLILLNNGNGGFSIQPTISLGSRANASAVADYNRDGKLDVAVGSLDSNFVSILLGNGDGTFRPRVDYGASSPRFLTTADVNRDGRTDLVVASVAGGVSVLRGRGDGTFEAAAYTSVGTRVVEVAAGDVNGDGWSDVVTANLDNNTVSLLLNDGTGKFPNFTNLPVGGSPHGVSLFDADHDGDLDVVSSNQNGGGITVLTNNGSGAFTRAADIATGAGPQGSAIGDLDGDGADDVAVAQAGGNNVAVLLSRATIHRVSLSAGQAASGLHFGNQLTAPAPGVNLSINGGAAFTKSRAVTLALTPTGVPREMRFAIDGQAEDRYSTWEPIAATKTLTLPNSEGSHSIYVQVRDAMGRIGLANGSIVLDTVTPLPPVYQGMWIDTGRSGNDWITRDHTIAIYGRAEPWATIEVTLAGVGVLGTTPVYGSGDWQFDYMHVTLNAGQYQFTTRTIDRAGNASAPTSPLRITIDGAAPSRPSITGISDDTGSPGDGGLPAGTYYLRVYGVGGVSNPNYTMELRHSVPATHSQAANIGTLASAQTLNDLVLADDEDWFGFES